MAELKNWLSPLISDLSWDTSFLFITTTVWILGSDTVPWTASIISLAQEQQNKGKLPFYDWLPAAALNPYGNLCCINEHRYINISKLRPVTRKPHLEKKWSSFF